MVLSRPAAMAWQLGDPLDHRCHYGLPVTTQPTFVIESRAIGGGFRAFSGLALSRVPEGYSVCGVLTSSLIMTVGAEPPDCPCKTGQPHS